MDAHLVALIALEERVLVTRSARARLVANHTLVIGELGAGAVFEAFERLLLIDL